MKMYIKRYTIAVAILIGAVGWFVYTYLTKETMRIDFFGYPLPELAIFLWVIVPLLILYIATILHISFYSFLASLRLRKYEKDSEKILDSMTDAYLGRENRDHKFITKRYKLLGSLIDNSSLTSLPSISKNSDNQNLNRVLNIIEDIKAGKTVDLTPYALSSTNSLTVENNRNRFNNKDITIEDILNNHEEYDDNLCKDAYLEYVKTATVENIKKYQQYMQKVSLFKMLTRVNTEKNSLVISNEDLILLFERLDLSEKDYINISIALSLGMIPEQRIKLFELLSENNDMLMKAYLFTLFDLEMNSLATDILNNSQPEEYQRFKAYNALKDSHKNFNINLFI